MNYNKKIAAFMYHSDREYHNNWNELIPVVKEILSHGYIETFYGQEALMTFDTDEVWKAICDWMDELDKWNEKVKIEYQRMQKQQK